MATAEQLFSFKINSFPEHLTTDCRIEFCGKGVSSGTTQVVSSEKNDACAYFLEAMKTKGHIAIFNVYDNQCNIVRSIELSNVSIILVDTGTLSYDAKDADNVLKTLVKFEFTEWRILK